MQSFLFENPWLIGFACLATTGLVAVIWIQTGHKAALLSTLGALALSVVLVLTNIQVETDREQVASVLNDVAAALEVNDFPRVYSYIHPGAVEGVQRAKSELPRFEFQVARVTRIKEIRINDDSEPPTAIAEFNVIVELTSQIYSGKVARFVQVHLMQREGRWLVTDYEHFEPSAGFRELP